LAWPVARRPRPSPEHRTATVRERAPVIPLLLQLATPDLTVRLAAEQSAQLSLTDAAGSALVTGGEASLNVRALGPESAYGLRARGLYGRSFSMAKGAQPGTDSLSAELSADAGVHLAPRLSLSLSTQAYLANRFGVRATDALAARDPFL